MPDVSPSLSVRANLEPPPVFSWNLAMPKIENSTSPMSDWVVYTPPHTYLKTAVAGTLI